MFGKRKNGSDEKAAEGIEKACDISDSLMDAIKEAADSTVNRDIKKDTDD